MSKPLRKCTKCGKEAWNESDLVFFRKSKIMNYGRENRCNTCYPKRERNPPYLRKCHICGIEAKTEKDLNLFIKEKRYLYNRKPICKKCYNAKTHPKKPYLRKCKECGLEANTQEELNNFIASKLYKIGRMNWCRKCYNKKQIEFRNSRVFHSLCTTKKSECLRRKLPFNLDAEYIKQLWERQQGICALSGLQMPLPYSKSSFDIVGSLDRIDCDKGYIKGNVRWVLNAINMLKQKRGDDFVYRVAEAIIKNKPNKFIPERL